MSHHNLVANVYQLLGPGATAPNAEVNIDLFLCFLPMYHIYGLNVALNPVLILGATLVLMPRFDVSGLLTRLLRDEGISMMPDGSTGDECALPGSGSRTVSEESQAALGKVGRRSTRA